MQIFKPMLRITRILFVFLLVPFSLCARERITSFDSVIQVDLSGVLTVIETIAVAAEGDQIKRGIYRDFPTDYTNRAGIRVKVGFKILSVKRDSRSEPYHTKRQGNGVRLYIGDKNVFLNPGPYTYSITYQTDRQIGFFADYDELYWNVTGNDWAFPIEQATATIVLPAGTAILQYSAYTGRQGSTAFNAKLVESAADEISFRTTAPLAPREGLTIAAAWPKGIIPEPDIKAKTSVFLLYRTTSRYWSAQPDFLSCSSTT